MIAQFHQRRLYLCTKKVWGPKFLITCYWAPTVINWWDLCGTITLLAWGPSDSLGRSLTQTRLQWWSITSGSPIYQGNANRRIPVPHKYPPEDLNPGPLWREAKGWSTGPVRHGENEVRLQVLHTLFHHFISPFRFGKIFRFGGGGEVTQRGGREPPHFDQVYFINLEQRLS
jgi:hypothetical protein